MNVEGSRVPALHKQLSLVGEAVLLECPRDRPKAHEATQVDTGTTEEVVKPPDAEQVMQHEERNDPGLFGSAEHETLDDPDLKQVPEAQVLSNPLPSGEAITALLQINPSLVEHNAVVAT